MKRIRIAPMIAPNAFNVASEEVSGNSVEFSLAGTTTLSPIVTPIVDSVTTFVTTSDFVTGVLMSVIGGGVGSSITGHDDIARPSQAIPVSHSSIVTTAFEPKKS